MSTLDTSVVDNVPAPSTLFDSVFNWMPCPSRTEDSCSTSIELTPGKLSGKFSVHRASVSCPTRTGDGCSTSMELTSGNLRRTTKLVRRVDFLLVSAKAVITAL